MPTGYTQIPRNALYVKNSDGSGPYYLTAGGVMTAYLFSGSGTTFSIGTESNIAIGTEASVDIGTEAA